MLGDMDVPPFWPSFLTFWGLNSIFLGYFFSSTNTKTIFWGIETTNSYRIRSFRPQNSFFMINSPRLVKRESSSIFLGPIFSGQRHTPISFRHTPISFRTPISIPIHAHTYMSMYKYTHTHLHILLWPDKEGSEYHIDHWLQNLLRRLRLKHCTHLSDPEISIKAWCRSHRAHLWQYRASRSMATRHWIIISLIVQCLPSNALRALAAY